MLVRTTTLVEFIDNFFSVLFVLDYIIIYKILNIRYASMITIVVSNG